MVVTDNGAVWDLEMDFIFKGIVAAVIMATTGLVMVLW
jgi:hypothetical protein